MFKLAFRIAFLAAFLITVIFAQPDQGKIIPAYYLGLAVNSIQLTESDPDASGASYRSALTGLTYIHAKSFIGWNLNIARAFSFNEPVYNTKNLHMLSWAEAGLNVPLYRKWNGSGFFSKFVILGSINFSFYNRLYLQKAEQEPENRFDDSGKSWYENLNFHEQEYPRYFDFNLEFRRTLFHIKAGYIHQLKKFALKRPEFADAPLDMSGAYFEAGFTLGGWDKAVQKPTAFSAKGNIEFQLGFEEPSADQVLDSGENGEILVKLKNKGKGNASNIYVDIYPSAGNDRGVVVQRSNYVSTHLFAGEIKTVRIPLQASNEISDGFVQFNVAVYGDNFKRVTDEIRVDLKRHEEPVKLSCRAQFEDDDGDGKLANGEQGWFLLRLRNEEEKVAIRPVITASVLSPNQTNFIIKPETTIENLPAGAEKTIRILADYNGQLRPGEVHVQFTVQGQNVVPITSDVTFLTAKPKPVTLIVKMRMQAPSNDNILDSGEQGMIWVDIENVSTTPAENVVMTTEFAKEYFPNITFTDSVVIGLIDPGIQHSVKVDLHANEKAESAEVSLKMNFSGSNFTTLQEEFTFQVNELDRVDTPILAKIKKEDAIAVVIGISDYYHSSVPDVEFAEHDARVMKEYLIRSLGFREKNIYPKVPAKMMTKGFISTFVKHKLPSLVKKDETELFVYYSGHGAPSTETKQAFLVPIDCDPDHVTEENAYLLDEFYGDLAILKPKKLTVVLDACFSGLSGSGESLLTNRSPINIVVKNPLVNVENANLFSSCKMDEVANWYPEKKHGMFTYYFLRALRGHADRDGDKKITVEEIDAFISDPDNGVPAKALEVFQRTQNPVIVARNPQDVVADYNAENIVDKQN